VNYDIPEQTEYYVHRVGRTGRGERKGLAISFCSEDEKGLLSDIESWLDKPISVLELSKDHRNTILAESADYQQDIKSLMGEIEKLEQKMKTKKKK
jgi:ATP-dependent RNA helicase RhlE